jgi:putative hydrolase of the HAD superfamily
METAVPADRPYSPLRRALPAALLLDLDDTIIDDSGGTAAAWQAVCAAAAEQLQTHDAAAILAAIDRVRDWYWADAARHREGRLDLSAARRSIVLQALASLDVAPAYRAALTEEIAAGYQSLRDEAVHPFPGALETLQALRDRRVRLALLTNGAGPAQRAKIARFGLEPFFDFIYVEGEHPCGKPDARVYRAALRALGAAPREAWMAGDNIEWDVAAPQRLGIHAIWVDGAGTGLPDGVTVHPDRIIRALPELAPNL